MLDQGKDEGKETKGQKRKLPDQVAPGKKRPRIHLTFEEAIILTADDANLYNGLDQDKLHFWRPFMKYLIEQNPHDPDLLHGRIRSLHRYLKDRQINYQAGGLEFGRFFNATIDSYECNLERARQPAKEVEPAAVDVIKAVFKDVDAAIAAALSKVTRTVEKRCPKCHRSDTVIEVQAQLSRGDENFHCLYSCNNPSCLATNERWTR